MLMDEPFGALDAQAKLLQDLELLRTRTVRVWRTVHLKDCQ
jgi:ABC-type nitrate/sulfonate/bicarbonate transport system ATPase subunit